MIKDHNEAVSRKRLKIAFFTDDYLPYVHGVTTSIQNYRQALEELGHEVWIVAPSPKQKDFVDDDDHVIRMPSINSYIFDKRPVSLLYPGISRKLDAYDFDVVHSQTQFYLGVIAGLVAKRKKIPHFTTIHTLYTELLDDYPVAVTAGLIAVSVGFPFVYKMRPILPFKSAKEILQLSAYDAAEIKKKQGWRLIAAAVNQATAGIAPSQHLARTLVENGTTVPVHVLPNGISLEIYRDSRAADSPIPDEKDTVTIICVARVSGEKRQHVLIDAIASMKQKARLVIVGDGPARSKFEEHARELGVADRVVFTGLKSAAEIASMLKQADIFALASYRFDNQPMVILEAIASGLPVVYCDDNLTEGLTTENSVLTAGIDGQHFAHEFDALCIDTARLGSMGKASIEIAKRFDRRLLAKQLEVFYECAIEAQNHKLECL